MKQCIKCKEIKDLDKFYKKKASKDGLQSACKTCANAQVNNWTAANRKRSNAIKDTWRYANPDKIRENTIKWGVANPGKRNAMTMKRIAAKLQATPKWLPKEQLLEIQKFYIKAVELTKSTGIPHEVDHIVPLQGKNVRGLHVPWNLQVVPRSYNRSKSNFIKS